MIKRNELFHFGMSLLDERCPETETMLYYHVYSLKFGDHFVIEDMKDLIELVAVINTWNVERKDSLCETENSTQTEKGLKIFIVA